MDFIEKVTTYIREEVRTPASTFSNLTYLVLGIALWSVNVWVAILMMILFVGSSGFHWAHEGHESWHRADIVAIYYTFAVIAGWLFFGAAGLVIGTVLGAVAHWSHYYDYSKYSQEIIGAFGLLALIGFFIQPENGWVELASVLILFFFAFLCSWIADNLEDETGKTYDGFHAAWHVWSGVGIYDLMTIGNSVFF